MAWVDRQLPLRDELFLDHVGYFVSNIEAARSQLERLGFQVSPPFVQMNTGDKGERRPSGTSNCMARLRLGFVEVIAETSETPLAGQLRSALNRYEGLHLIAFSHADLDMRREGLLASGFRMQDVLRIGAQVVSWSVLRPQEGVMPEGRVQFVTCHTPELSWPAGSTRHDNQADAITDILLCVADREEAGARFGRYLQRQPVEQSDYSVIPTDRGSLSLVEPSSAALFLPEFELPDLPYMAALALSCEDPSQVQTVLLKQGITPVYCDDELVCVHPTDGLGAYLLFHSRYFADPWESLRFRAGRMNQYLR
jgi:hypothetical protein